MAMGKFLFGCVRLSGFALFGSFAAIYSRNESICSFNLFT